jgi:hypothetical protein
MEYVLENANLEPAMDLQLDGDIALTGDFSGSFIAPFYSPWRLRYIRRELQTVKSHVVTAARVDEPGFGTFVDV